MASRSLAGRLPMSSSTVDDASTVRTNIALSHPRPRRGTRKAKSAAAGLRDLRNPAYGHSWTATIHLRGGPGRHRRSPPEAEESKSPERGARRRHYRERGEGVKGERRAGWRGTGSPATERSRAGGPVPRVFDGTRELESPRRAFDRRDDREPPAARPPGRGRACSTAGRLARFGTGAAGSLVPCPGHRPGHGGSGGGA